MSLRGNACGLDGSVAYPGTVGHVEQLLRRQDRRVERPALNHITAANDGQVGELRPVMVPAGAAARHVRNDRREGRRRGAGLLEACAFEKVHAVVYLLRRAALLHARVRRRHAQVVKAARFGARPVRICRGEGGVVEGIFAGDIAEGFATEQVLNGWRGQVKEA